MILRTFFSELIMLRRLGIGLVFAFGTASPSIAQNDAYLDGTISAAPEATTDTFSQGFPTADTANAIYRNSDLRRAIEAYKTFLPTLATEAVIQQMINAGAKPNEIGIVMAQGPKQQFAATNSDTPYSLTTLDLNRDSPIGSPRLAMMVTGCASHGDSGSKPARQNGPRSIST